MLERDLDPDRWPTGSEEHTKCQSIAVVYANTWLFEGYDDAKAAILSSVLLELKEHKRFGPKVREGAISLLKSVNWMRVVRLTMKHVALPAAAALITGGVAAIPAAIALSTGLAGLLPHPATGNEKKDLPGDNKDKTSWDDLLKKDPSEACSGP